MTDKATVKALLAAAGQSMHPEAQVQAIEPPAPGEHGAVILLERVVSGEVPEYCVHGYATCVRCSELCWLGDNTMEVVASGQAYPLCLNCGEEIIPEAQRATPPEHVEDHLRSQGPH